MPPTEIQSPNSNLNNLPQRTNPPPEERSNVASQLFGYDRDEPKDYFTTEIMGSDKGSDYMTNFAFVPPSPPPLDSVFDLAPITSPLLPHTSSYSVSYYSPYSQCSELSFSDDDIQMQDVSGGVNEYEPSDYDAPNQSASLFMFTIDPDCMPQQQQSLPGTNSDHWNLNFLSATLGLEKMDVGSERGDDFPTQPLQTSDPGYHHHPLSSLIDSATAASTALLFPPSNNSPGMDHFPLTSSSTRSDHGAEVWGSSMSPYHSLGSTTAASTALLIPPSNNPPSMGLFRRASSSTWSDRGAEVWGSSGRQKHHQMTPHRMSPYPSSNASPRVRHTSLELEPDLTVMGTGLSDLHDPPVGASENQRAMLIAYSGGRKCSQTSRSPDSNAPSASQIDVLPSRIPKVNVTTGRTANASHRRRKQDANFTCTVPGCGSTFTRGFNLKSHLRSHFEEKPYKCRWSGCGKSFARQYDCQRHEQLHDNWSFECEGCKKQFARMDALNRHLKSEAGVECARIAERGKGAGGGRMGVGNREGGYDKGKAVMRMRDGIVELGTKLEEEKRQTGGGGSRGDGWAGVAL
jgi:Zinc finger, C2H2 type